MKQVNDAATYVEMCVQDMSDAGISPGMICIALARLLRQQAELAVPDDKASREVFLSCLVVESPKPENMA